MSNTNDRTIGASRSLNGLVVCKWWHEHKKSKRYWHWMGMLLTCLCGPQYVKFWEEDRAEKFGTKGKPWVD